MLFPFLGKSQVHLQVSKVAGAGLGVVKDMCIYDSSIYIASSSGLWVYNFQRLSPIVNEQGVSPNDISGIHPSDSGIYLGYFDSGLGHYSSDWQRFTIGLRGSDTSYNLPSSRVSRIFGEYNGTLWFENHLEGLIGFNPKEKDLSLHPLNVETSRNQRGVNALSSSVQLDSSGSELYIGTLDGIYVFDFVEKRIVRHFPLGPEDQTTDLPYSSRENAVRYLLEKDGHLYAATWGGGLLKVDHQTGAYEKFIFMPSEPFTGLRNNIRRIGDFNDSLILVGPPQYQMQFFNVKTQQFQQLLSLDGRPIVPEVEGILQVGKDWYFTTSNGLFKLESVNEHITVYPSSSPIMDVQPNRSGFEYSLFSKTNEVYSIEDNRRRVSRVLPEERVANSGIEFFEYKGYKAFITRSQVFTYSKGDLNAVPVFGSTFKVPSEITVAYLDSSSGNLFFGTKRGQLEQVNLVSSEYKLLIPSNENGWICDISVFQDTLWFTAEHYIGYHVDGKTTTYTIEELFQPLKIQPEIVHEIEVNKEGLTLGLSKGGAISLGRTFNLKQVWEASGVTDKLVDFAWHQGFLYMLRENGLSIHSKSGESQYFSSAYGFKNMLWLRKKGKELWAGGYHGLYRLDHVEQIQRKSFGPVEVEQLKVQNEIMGLSTGKLVIEPEQNWFQLQLKVHNPNALALKSFYQLEGLHKDWRPLSPDMKLAYTGLKPGKYKLNVKTIAPGERALEQGVVHLEVKKIWWQKTWIQACFVLFIIVVLTGVFWQRLRLLRKQNELRLELQNSQMQALRSQMNPHFLFNALNSVRFYILKENVNTASSYLAKFSKLLRLILNHSRKEFLPLESELELIELYIDFERSRFQQEINFKKFLAEEIDPKDITIPSMVLQPFIENSIWHGFRDINRPGNIIIHIEKNEDALVLVATDDGIGREAATKQRKMTHQSQGLSITENRLKIMGRIRKSNFGFTIEDLRDNGKPSGTRVTITLPYENLSN